MQVVEVSDSLVLRVGWWDEFHGVDSSNDILLTRESLLDVTHGDLLVSLGSLRNDTDTVLVELDDSLHHTNGLVKWTVVIIV